MNENLAVTTESLAYDQLHVAGNGFPIVTDSLLIASGQKLLRGTVVGVQTNGNKGAKVDSSKSDGTQIPYAIVAQDVDATLADSMALVYLTGEFNGAALIFGGSDTIATHKAALRRIGLFIKGRV